MNNSIKRSVVLSAILVITLCLSIITGATLSMLTIDSNVNIATNSGKVSVVATIDQTSVYTKQLNTTYSQGLNNMYESVPQFTNEGLTLNNLVLGDGIKFNIEVDNQSSVTVKYRTVISCKNDGGLFEGLKVEIGEGNVFDGERYASSWETISVGAGTKTVPVTIELPETAGNEYLDKSCVITYTVEAIQGNAYTGPNAIITRYSDTKLKEELTNISPLTDDWGGIPFPDHLPETVSVEAAWTFTAVDTPETVLESPYKDWICDFVIECDDAVEYGELGLWGKYGGMSFAFGNPYTLTEGQTLFMLTSVGLPQTYKEICTNVINFDCGVFRGAFAEPKDGVEPMKGKTVSVSLCLINPEYAGNLAYELTGKTMDNLSLDELLLVMRKENWVNAIGTDVLIANQTQYYFE